MGQLVFQANAGGQTALVGPNPSTSISINIPATNGNMVTTGDSGTVTSTMLATSVYTAPGTIGSGTPNSGAFTTLSASSTATLNTLVSSGATLTGGSINGMAIGGTTAAAGAFTTLGASGVATFSAGTVSAPAITTTGDTNTGIFFPAADTIAFTEGGAEAMRIDSAGNVTLQKNISVGGAAPTTSGTGITFPATQSASSNANTLDDYEEGTWTPTYTASGCSFTYSEQYGSYVKIGSLVTAQFRIQGASASGSTGNSIQITGFPFTSANLGSLSSAAGGVGLNTFPTIICPEMTPNSTSMNPWNANNPSIATAANSVGAYLMVTVSYRSNN